MSTDNSSSSERPALAPYAPGAGPDRYVRFAQDIFGMDLAEVQRRILRAIEQHQQVVIVSGNGAGKSYAVAAAIGAFLFCNPQTTVNLTSGSYSQLDDAIWKPLKGLHKHAEAKWNLPGRRLENPPRLLTELDDEWFFKAVSPRYPENLEGRHNNYMMSVIEEADKPDITEEHLDSAASTVTDSNDRLVVIANPPKDEANFVYDLLHSDDWERVQFSSFESRNVLRDAGKTDHARIPGLVDLEKLRKNWVAWNDREWPGFEEARTNRDPELDQRWFRRRLGEVPPASTEVHRPIYPPHVETASDRYSSLSPSARRDITYVRKGMGIDIGHEGGDRTVVAQIRGDLLEIWEVEQFNEPWENEELIVDALEDDPLTGHCAIDAIGEGKGPASNVQRSYPRVFQFKANSTARENTEFYDKKSEAYALLGRFLRDSALVADQGLEKELAAAARTMEFEERTRGPETVLITSKQPVKDRLGTSPDLLDAASMAAWAAFVDNPMASSRKRSRMFYTNPW